MYIKHKDATINYTDQGSGPVVVLLHGFLENKEMWREIAPTLTQSFRVICVDLLGHGKSDCLGYIHSMNLFAETVMAVIAHLSIPQVTIIGHSMGGYVGIAFAKAYPEKIKGLCLLNATPLEDSDERKQLRARANTMAKKSYAQLVRLSFTNLFDPELKVEYEQEIDTAIKEALATPQQGYIAANSGMSKRPDNVHFWNTSTFKKGLILGKNDWIINAEELENLLKDTSDHFTSLDGGHMLHITNTSGTIRQIKLFLNI